MHQRFSVDIAADPVRLHALVADLGTYDRWLDIVHRVEPAVAAPGDPGSAWWVTLRARLGPLARSKRLRMVRTVDDAPCRATFERRETDGRDHSAWILTSTVDTGAGAPADGGAAGVGAGPVATVTMELRYDGGLWTPVLEAVLGGQVTSAGENLRVLATADT